jgi:hypothetical protein
VSDVRFMTFRIMLLSEEDDRRFLYQDPTREALQVFLPNPELVTNGTAANGLVINARGKPDISPEAQEGLQQGVWVNANPVRSCAFVTCASALTTSAQIPGCLVCNIGESERAPRRV